MNGRYDGTSRFPKNKRYGFFPSGSVAWRVDVEPFFEPLRSLFSQFKIRASYGVNGNQPGSYYGYKGLYSYGENYMEAAGSYESSQPNVFLRW